MRKLVFLYKIENFVKRAILLEINWFLLTFGRVYTTKMFSSTRKILYFPICYALNMFLPWRVSPRLPSQYQGMKYKIQSYKSKYSYFNHSFRFKRPHTYATRPQCHVGSCKQLCSCKSDFTNVQLCDFMIGELCFMTLGFSNFGGEKLSYCFVVSK